MPLTAAAVRINPLHGIIPGLENRLHNQYVLWLKFTFFLKQYRLQSKIFTNKTWVISWITVLQAWCHYTFLCSIECWISYARHSIIDLTVHSFTSLTSYQQWGKGYHSSILTNLARLSQLAVWDYNNVNPSWRSKHDE